MSVEKAFNNLNALELRAAWDCRVEIAGFPEELDILAKDWSYDPLTLSLEQSDVGARQTSHVTGQEHVSKTLTLRDSRDKKLYNLFLKWGGEIVHSDGTFGLPARYVRKVSLYYDEKNGREKPEVYYMFVSEIAGISPDRASREPQEFTVTLTEWKTGMSADKMPT